MLTARSSAGRECVVARLGAGQFFGESCLAGRLTRATATTCTTCSVSVIETATMKRLLRLANHGTAGAPVRSGAKLSHDRLAKLVVGKHRMSQLL